MHNKSLYIVNFINVRPHQFDHFTILKFYTAHVFGAKNKFSSLSGNGDEPGIGQQADLLFVRRKIIACVTASCW